MVRLFYSETAIREALGKEGILNVSFNTGFIELDEEISKDRHILLKRSLLELDIILVEGKKNILVEQIKNAIIELICKPNIDRKNNYSELLSSKLNHNYTYLANVFSEVNDITIQQFIIYHKIEYVKQYLYYNELNLTEIANIMGYSSVGHLSFQFKKHTGLSPSEYKKHGSS